MHIYIHIYVYVYMYMRESIPFRIAVSLSALPFKMSSELLAMVTLEAQVTPYLFLILLGIWV